jgi:hypothetical protein
MISNVIESGAMKNILYFIVLAAFLSTSCGDTQGGAVDITVVKDIGSDTGSDTNQSTDATDDASQTDASTDAGAEDAGPDAGCDANAENACAEAGATRCATNGDPAVERCEEIDGCTMWLTAEPCAKLNKCTGVADICSEGTCVPPEDAPDPNAACDEPDNSCIDIKCDPADGFCKELPIADDLLCDDGDVCTENDFCFNGECQAGEDVCPKTCQLDDISCGTAITTNLVADGKDTMSAYGCEGTGEGYDGAERVFKLQVPAEFDFDCLQELGGGATVTVEFDSPEDIGAEFVDIIQIDDSKGICWPADCKAAAMMTEGGTVQLEFDLLKGEQYFLVVDGRSGFEGSVRVSAACCGQKVEICSNGIDDDLDSDVDCQDEDCADSGLCNFEFDCTDGKDNDDNGKVDCDDDACAASEDCNLEFNCTDGVDDDDDGKIDCEDPDCAGDDACAESCDGAIVLTCGDTKVGEQLGDGDNVQLANLTTCNQAALYSDDEGHKQRFYQVQPNCEGEYTVTVDTAGYFDFHILETSCSEDAFCAGTTTIFGGPESFKFSTKTYPSVWAGIMSVYSNPALFTGEYAISVTCQCE